MLCFVAVFEIVVWKSVKIVGSGHKGEQDECVSETFLFKVLVKYLVNIGCFRNFQSIMRHLHRRHHSHLNELCEVVIKM